MKLKMANDFVIVKKYVGEKNIGKIIVEKDDESPFVFFDDPKTEVVFGQNALRYFNKKSINGSDDYDYYVINKKDIYFTKELK